MLVILVIVIMELQNKVLIFNFFSVKKVKRYICTYIIVNYYSRELSISRQILWFSSHLQSSRADFLYVGYEVELA